MSAELPVPAALKITPKAVYVGDPKQLVNLLASDVAVPIIEITKTKGQVPLYKLKLRCKTLFEGNLDVYFHLDWPNQTLQETVSSSEAKEPEVHVALARDSSAVAVDVNRARRWGENLELALSYWSVKMEEAVTKLYPDRTPTQIDRFQREGVLELRINPFVKNFNLEQFLANCVSRHGSPCFRVLYGWISGKEDPRTTDQVWGYKFEFSPYAQFPPVPRSRKPVSASERQDQLLKKRKQNEEEEKTDAV